MFETQFVETQRYGDFDIDHDDRTSAATRSETSRWRSGGWKEEAPAIRVTDGACQQMLKHHSMASDMPARIETMRLSLSKAP